MAENHLAKRARERGEAMEVPADKTPVRYRVLERKKGWLGGWHLIGEGVGAIEFYESHIADHCILLRDGGEDPADYEYRIDTAPATEWQIGVVIDGRASK